MSNEVFLDTSIMIARVVHSQEMKQRIANRLSSHSYVFTSIVVKQEFKRRLLKDAVYLLNQVNSKRSYKKVYRHVLDVLPPQQYRKQKISLQMLATVFEHATDQELTERLRRYLRSLLRFGLADFVDSVNYVLWDSGCACSYYPVVEKSPYLRYDLGPERCSKVTRKCGIVAFIEDNKSLMLKILTFLSGVPVAEMSAELKRAHSFIETTLKNSADTTEMDPCLTVGDLIIAMESFGVASFYTLNSRESQHFCRVLNQHLIAQPPNYHKDEVVCLASNSVWPKF